MNYGYDDEKLAENFEMIARAYSKSLKNRGFVFIKISEEKCKEIAEDVATIFEKIIAIFNVLERELDCSIIFDETIRSYTHFCRNFFIKEKTFSIDVLPGKAFLILFSLESRLTIRLIDLMNASGEIDFCEKILLGRAKIYAESFDEGKFKLV